LGFVLICLKGVRNLTSYNSISLCLVETFPFVIQTGAHPSSPFPAQRSFKARAYAVVLFLYVFKFYLLSKWSSTCFLTRDGMLNSSLICVISPYNRRVSKSRDLH
jgi:hypothetical protein